MKNILRRIIILTILTTPVILPFTGTCHGQTITGIIAAESSVVSPQAGEQTEPQQQQSQEILQPETKNLAPSDIELPLGNSSTYTLGVNDAIAISVLRHPEVSGEYIINNEGKIQFEFVGDVKVIGLTKDEISELLAELLSKYIIEPEVTVKITGYNSKVVYVIGEVGRPGKIYMRGDTITVREALVQSGLPTLGASTKKCRLITPDVSGKAATKYINVFKLLYEGDLRENLVMRPGDTLYVPATVLTKAMRVISPITAPVSAAAGTGKTVMTGF